MNYQNFDLLLERTTDGYRARVIASPAGQAGPVDFLLPFSPEELRSFYWIAGQSRRSFRLRPEPEQRPAALDAQTFGRRLYDSVFRSGIDASLLRSLDAADGRGDGLRIRLRIDRSAPELAELPWEYLYLEPHGRFLSLSPETPVVRYLELPFGEETLRVEGPLQILCVIANPDPRRPLQVEGEWARVQSATADLQAGGRIALQRLERATLPALQRHLRRHTVHVLHFIGHGAFDAEAGRGGLLFEHDDGTFAGESHGHLVTAAQLSTLLHGHHALRLIFLNACEGARAGRTDSLAGVAQHLVASGVPGVIAMQFEVTDRAAITLAHEFYQALVDGYPVDAALAEARKAIFVGTDAGAMASEPGRFRAEWGTPVLFSRSPDNNLLTVAPAAENPPWQRAYYEPETVPVPAGPFRMGSSAPGAPPHEQPEHNVELPAFRIGVYPVTNAQYEVYVRQTEQLVPARLGWVGQRAPVERQNHPVAGVTLYEALAYCRWLSEQTGRAYGLPNEAQWEKAARGTDGRLYPWGDTWRENRCHFGERSMAAVDAYPPQSPYGCFDMVGNVREWTCSLWGERSRSPDPRYGYPWAADGRNECGAGEHLRRIVRGGASQDERAALRCCARQSYMPTRGGPPRKPHGFRVVLLEA